MSIKKISLLAVYTTIALTIFMIESFIPVLVPIPGIKLGLANIVTLWLLTLTNWKDTLLVLIMRIILASIFAGQIISFAYSLCGGLLCFFIMVFLYRFLGKDHLVFISIAGAIFHNLGQILIAFLILQSNGVFSYLPLLMISGIITGTFTGFCTYFASKKFPPSIVWPL